MSGWKWKELGLLLFVISLCGCGGVGESLAVSDIWEQHTSLDGKRVIVRGEPYFKFEPYHPRQVGGRIPAEEGRPQISLTTHFEFRETRGHLGDKE